MAHTKKTKGTAPATAGAEEGNQGVNAGTAVREEPARMQRPAYIDGSPVDEEGRVIKSPTATNDGQMELGADSEQGKSWGPSYKAILTTATFEMGEDRRFKQRVFKFREKPAAEVLERLKENGFTYRPSEQAWTISGQPRNSPAISDRQSRRGREGSHPPAAIQAAGPHP